MNTIGERLKKIRIDSGKTQKVMAEILEVTLSMYQKYESNKSNLSVKGAVTLMKEFEISIDWLLTGTSSYIHPDAILGAYITRVRREHLSIDDIYSRLVLSYNFFYDKTNDIVKLTLSEKKKIIFKEFNSTSNENIKIKTGIFGNEVPHLCNELPYMAILQFSMLHHISLEWLFFGTIHKKTITDKELFLNLSENIEYKYSGITI